MEKGSVPVCFQADSQDRAGFTHSSVSVADETKLAFLREATFMSTWGGLSPGD